VIVDRDLHEREARVLALRARHAVLIPDDHEPAIVPDPPIEDRGFIYRDASGPLHRIEMERMDVRHRPIFLEIAPFEVQKY
jgi:hypothetical protein